NNLRPFSREAISHLIVARNVDATACAVARKHTFPKTLAEQEVQPPILQRASWARSAFRKHLVLDTFRCSASKVPSCSSCEKNSTRSEASSGRPPLNCLLW